MNTKRLAEIGMVIRHFFFNVAMFLFVKRLGAIKLIRKDIMNVQSTREQ